MDNDLMARRLRPPSQPTPTPNQNGQYPPMPSTPPAQPLAQVPAPDPMPSWDTPMLPDPAARADVPWDRPAPEPWPPTTDEPLPIQPWNAKSEPGEAWRPTNELPTWPPTSTDQLEPTDPASAPAAQASAPSAQTQSEPEPEVPWDRPTPEYQPVDDRTPDMFESYHEMVPAAAKPPLSPAVPAPRVDAMASDPYDAMAPVVADVTHPAPQASWPSWNGNSPNGAHRFDEPAPAASEPMAVAAGADPHARYDAERTADQYWQPAQSEPAWDGPIDPASMRDAQPGQPPVDMPPVRPLEIDAEFYQPTQPAPAAAMPPHPADAMPPAPSMVTPLVSATFVPATPTAADAPSAPSAPTNMVLRIELAIVDERRASPAETARRVGPSDEDVAEPVDRYTPRHPEFEPRNHVAAEPPARDVDRGQSMPSADEAWQPPARSYVEPSGTQYIAPPADAWQPAPQALPQAPQAVTLAWDLPAIGPSAAEPQPASWDAPAPHSPAQPYFEPPAQVAPFSPTYEQQYRPAAPAADPWSARPGDSLAGLPAAPFVPPAPYAPNAPLVPSTPAPGASAPVAARGGQPTTAGAQSDLWFLAQPAPAAVAEETAEDEASEGRQPSSLLTAGLTIGFAILVIVLVLVFIQLMTSLLR